MGSDCLKLKDARADSVVLGTDRNLVVRGGGLDNRTQDFWIEHERALVGPRTRDLNAFQTQMPLTHLLLEKHRLSLTLGPIHLGPLSTSPSLSPGSVSDLPPPSFFITKS